MAASAAPTVTAVTNSEISPLKHDDTEREIWRGHSGDFDLRWTTKDLFVIRNGKKEAIFSTYAKKWAAQVTKDQHGATNTISFRVLSVVGDLVSLEICYSIAANDSATVDRVLSWVTVDLSKSGEMALPEDLDRTNIRNAALTDYFADVDILRALLSTDAIRDALLRMNHPVPDTLDGLLGIRFLKLNDNDNRQINSYCLKQFVFEEVDSGEVSIALEVWDAFNFHMHEVQQLKITLPINGVLAAPLLKAKRGQEGFLHHGGHGVLQDAKTEFVFKTE
jgi:hypothetical protein